MSDSPLADAVARAADRVLVAANTPELRARRRSIEAALLPREDADSRLTEILAAAARNAPFYAASLHKKDLLQLAHFPILTKEDLRDRAFDLIVRGDDWLLPRMTYHLMRTSGSGGRPVTTLKSAEEDGFWDAVMEERLYSEFGVPSPITLFNLSPAQAMGKPLVTAHVSCRPTIKINLRALNGTDEVYREYTSVASAVRPDVVRGSPTRILDFISVCRSSGVGVRPSLVISTHEECTQAARDVMMEFFACPVVSLYGTTETGLVGWSCDNWHIHLHDDLVRYEVTSTQDNPSGPGHLLLTNLKSSVMPMIRYDTGDVAETVQCPCGDVRPAIKLYGRSGGVIHRVDGQTLTPFLLYLVLDDLGLWDFQVQQHTPGRITVVVRQTAVGDRPISAIEQQISRRLEDLCRVSPDQLVVSIDTDRDFSIDASGKKQPLVTGLARVTHG